MTPYLQIFWTTLVTLSQLMVCKINLDTRVMLAGTNIFVVSHEWILWQRICLIIFTLSNNCTVVLQKGIRCPRLIPIGLHPSITLYSCLNTSPLLLPLWSQHFHCMGFVPMYILHTIQWLLSTEFAPISLSHVKVCTSFLPYTRKLDGEVHF